MLSPYALIKEMKMEGDYIHQEQVVALMEEYAKRYHKENSNNTVDSPFFPDDDGTFGKCRYCSEDANLY